jgi:hypothetical protein
MPHATLHATCHAACHVPRCMLRAEETVELSAAEIDAVHKKDTLTLQSYGRPCACLALPWATSLSNPTAGAINSRSQPCYTIPPVATVATRTAVAMERAGFFPFVPQGYRTVLTGTTLAGSPQARTTPTRKGRRCPSSQNGPMQSLRPSSLALIARGRQCFK